MNPPYEVMIAPAYAAGEVASALARNCATISPTATASAIMMKLLKSTKHLLENDGLLRLDEAELLQGPAEQWNDREIGKRSCSGNGQEAFCAGCCDVFGHG